MSDARKPVLLLDGGLGTALQAAPYSQVFDATTPTWSSHLLISDPSSLERVQAEFAKAGADILLTATYQASFEGFSRTRRVGAAVEPDNGQAGYSSEETGHYMRSAIKVAKLAAAAAPAVHGRSSPPSVALSLGAYGATLVPSQEYSGTYPQEMSSKEALLKWHADRLAVFSSDRPTWDAIDFVAWETMRNVNEVIAAREAMAVLGDCSAAAAAGAASSASRPGKRWWISAVWPDDPDPREVDVMVRAMLGDRPAGNGANESPVKSAEGFSEAARTATPAPWAIGINCTAVEKLDTLIQHMADSIQRLENDGIWKDMWPWLVLYPNGSSDLKYNSTSMEWVPSGIEKDSRPWSEVVWHIVQRAQRGQWGGILVGGCCMTTPEDIARLRRHIDGLAEAI